MISSSDNSKMIIQSSISRKWVISEKILITKKNSVVASDYRDIPNLCNAKLNIYLHPSGYDEASRGHMIISPDLIIGDENNIAAEFLISIETANFTRKFETTYDQSNYCCHQTCCTTDELFDPEKKFIVDGELTVKVEGILKVEKPILQMSINTDDLGVRLWNESDSKDFTIVIGDKEFKVHKFVLAVRSPVFKKMLESNMKEAKENKVVITDFPFEVGIKLCYFRNLTVFLSMKNKILLLQFFDKYDLQELKDEFETCLINEIDASNVCTFANGSLLSNATKLQNKCSDFLMDCLKTTTAVCDLDILDKEFALKLFKDAYSVVSKTV